MAAKKIQRWYKSILEKRMIAEIERVIEEQKIVNKMRKAKMLGRESIEVWSKDS